MAAEGIDAVIAAIGWHPASAGIAELGCSELSAISERAGALSVHSAFALCLLKSAL